MARAADDIILLEDAWSDFLGIEDDDPAKDAIADLLYGATFAEAFEVWVTAASSARRDLRGDYTHGLERADDGDGWSRVIVGGWAIVYQPLTPEQRDLAAIDSEPSDETLVATVVSGIRRRRRART